MSDPDFESLLSVAKKAALLAGDFLSSYSQANRKIHKEFVHDVKIEADVQSERIILDYLMKNSDLSILSEEKGTIERDIKDYCWIVDPVDGSLNYAQQIPLCCVSIGLWRGESPILGVIYDFNREELFFGIVKKGAWLNETKIQVSRKNTKQSAVLLSGFPIQTDFSSRNLSHFVESIQSYKKVRLLGSAALSIAYVAAGRADAYWENDIMFWDVAGGIPLAMAAGGHCHTEKTSIAYGLNVRVTNGQVKTERIFGSFES